VITKCLVDWMVFIAVSLRITLMMLHFILIVRCVRAKEIVKSGRPLKNPANIVLFIDR